MTRMNYRTVENARRTARKSNVKSEPSGPEASAWLRENDPTAEEQALARQRAVATRKATWDAKWSRREQRVLAVVEARPGIWPDDIAQATPYKRSVVDGTVKRLKNEKLIWSPGGGDFDCGNPPLTRLVVGPLDSRPVARVLSLSLNPSLVGFSDAATTGVERWRRRRTDRVGR